MNKTILLDAVTVTSAALPYIAELNEITAFIASIIAICCGARTVFTLLKAFIGGIISKIKARDIVGAVEDVGELIDDVKNALEGGTENDTK
jgi:hypothetical protein